ncbi:MAG: thymidylate synthase ThyX [Bacteroidaceae bacterium]|nr:thymidylate synthase ThyX [Bacteroidaceae bacterium]MBR4930424.1 thymidylate synthase ThyX [Bacteroidaceae bacterium]
MKTEILKIKGDWKEVVDDCRATVGKESLGKEPSTTFKRKVLLAEHSPIRDIIFKWRWRDMAHWVTVHWVRHKWEKFVRTQRSDRTGVPREKLPQDEPQTFTGEANVQALIDTMRKRLCFQASRETRLYAEDLKQTIHAAEHEISDVLVPNCVYRCGCPEMAKCPLSETSISKQSYWETLIQQTGGRILTDDVQKRYDLYNEVFWRGREK